MTPPQDESVKNVNAGNKGPRIAEKKRSKTSKNPRNASNPEFMTRIVIRQLPATMTEEQFLDVVSPLPSHDEFYYVNGDLALGEFAFSRAYVKFNNIDDVLYFRGKFDNYIFIDGKGNEYPAVVEYAPLQRLPRRFNSVKKDTKINTLESDPDFIAFKEALENPDPNAETPPEVTTAVVDKDSTPDNATQTAPLVEFLNKKRMEKLKMKEEKKRKKIVEKKKRQEDSNAETARIYRSNKKEQKRTNTDSQPPAKEPTTKKAAAGVESVSKNKNVNDGRKKEKTIIILKPTDERPKPSSSTGENNKKEPGETSGAAAAKPKGQKNNKGPEEMEEQRKERERIRNKDRPAREIYRPAPRRENRNRRPSSDAGDEPQQQTANDETSSGSKAPGGEKNVPSTSQGAAPKYKYTRVFTRSKRQ